MGEKRGWQFWMDTGGTFTDCLARDPDGLWRRAKVLSSGTIRVRVVARPGPRAAIVHGAPSAPGAGPVGFWVRSPGGEGEARVAGWDCAAGCVLLDREVGWGAGATMDFFTGEEAPVVAMRWLTGCGAGPLPAGCTLALATTRGTNALLEGKGARVALFVTEGFGDLLRIGDQRRPDLFALQVRRPAPLHGPVVEVPGRLAADGQEIVPLDLSRVADEARRLRSEGCEVAAVALMHSYRSPAHERAVAAVLREAGFAHVSVSSELAAHIKIVPRAATAVVDALLAPVMQRYLAGVASVVDPQSVRVMTSAGGLVPLDRYRPKDSLLSGPAGGVAGAAEIARRAGLPHILSFDMGGTSTDVARFDGEFEYRSEHAVAAARVMAPALRVESVAAGGGSICRFDGSALVVGPESAGAHPGPACYGAGGPLTLTDVHLLLGRLDPDRFAVPVFPAAAEEALAAVLGAMARAGASAPAREAVLRGFLDIADERMAGAIRRISVREGYDPAGYALVAFGGAGGLHACAVAARLGIRRVLHPADSGLLSARGLVGAGEERIVERSVLRVFTDVVADLPALFEQLEREARAALGQVPAEAVRVRAELEMRFVGQDAGLTVPALPVESIHARFIDRYSRRFGYVPGDRPVEIVAVRVVVATATQASEGESFARTRSIPAAASGVFCGREALQPGDGFDGPRLVQDGFSTLYLAPGWTAVVGSHGSLLLEHTASLPEAVRTRDEVVALELFTSRFRSLVEDMGQILQRCALSVNIKERLDFSCALLDAEGYLVANAPHVPVHLGALGLCVREVARVLDLGPGDVAVTNHPACGGSHLPDVTLIAPVFGPDGMRLGYVANRAHHAEIGGIRPGSMPPAARNLAEEGVVIAPRCLTRDGTADWDGLRRLLSGGSHPSRRIDENLADLHAQLASIQLGADGLREMAARHGSSCVRHYMKALRERAAEALKAALGALGPRPLEAADALDDGTPVVVCIRHSAARLRVDFTGSGPVHPGNLNATPAIVRSALIYVMRLLAARDLPLNEGLMRDVDLVVPEGLLAPCFPADPALSPAVVGGNVETSQRVVDVLLSAFGLAAASQGTMNNLIIGNDRFSYYETIGGGTGAGPGFEGCDGVHSHMTNTAITDPEILELRLPLRLERFALRRGSGGRGRYRGGDGLERVLTFLESADLSLLAQRRKGGPPGRDGGGPGSPGEQWIERADGTRVALGGCAASRVGPGDRLVIRTPGGGAWGP